MRKIFSLFSYFIALLLFVSACGKKEEGSFNITESAAELGKEFINKLYSVEYPSSNYYEMSVNSRMDAQNEFSSYFTEEEFKGLANQRVFLMPLEAATKQNSTISVQDITFDNYKLKSEQIDFDHSFTLILTDTEGNETAEIEINGQMTVVDSKNGLKIDRYYDSQIPKDMLVP